MTFKLFLEIEQMMDLRYVVEERILDRRIKLILCEIFGIAKKESHAVIIDLMKRKRHSTEVEGTRPMNVNVVTTNGFEVEEDYVDSQNTRPQWATMKTLMSIRDVKETMVALIDHGSKINLMSLKFYKKGKWSINTKHGWTSWDKSPTQPTLYL